MATFRGVRAWVWARRRSVVSGALAGLAVVLAVAFVPPMVQSARRERCVVNLKRLGVAISKYNEAHGTLPPPAITRGDGTPLLSWRVEILPELGYPKLYDAFRRDEPWDSPHNLALLAEMPPVFDCPEGRGWGRSRATGYRVVVGPRMELGSVNTPFEPGRGVDLREMTDGTSNTLAVVESGARVPWTKPDELAFGEKLPLPGVGSRHRGGFHGLFVDGSVRFLKTTISQTILRSLFTDNGGEVVSA